VTLYCCLGQALAPNSSIGAKIPLQIISPIHSKSQKFATVQDVLSSSREEEEEEPEIDASKFSWPYPSKEEAKYIFDPGRFDAAKEWCVYSVMLVEWIEGVGDRLGLGRVHIDAFFEAKPRWKHVALG
jgi:hypothetical protein